MSKIKAGLFGTDYQHRARDVLSQKFLVPPFTVLNAREGWWQERKRQWLALGIKSELGRGENLLKMSDTVRAGGYDKRGKSKSAPEGEEEGSGTSIFDPVLCELIYRWFAPPNADVLDPFAGGSVRGIMASLLGHRYVGMDLSEKQVAANREQAAQICSDPLPVWLLGDSSEISMLAEDAPPDSEGLVDLIFSCPPYGSLERYSDDPRDLSTMSPEGFAEKYERIIRESCSLLRPEGFACFVVGDYRNPKSGFYENLPSLTILAYEEAGLRLYNRAILVTATGSLPLRVQKMFASSRKLGPTHQEVLIFAKGQPKDFVRNWPALSLEE